jgi:CubicO group peptidase (beta-lactamase class C family)
MVKITRREAVVGALIGAAAGLGRSPAIAQGAGARGQIDQTLRSAADAGQVPGVVAVAANDKGTMYEGAFGKRNIVNGPAMTPDSVFWIASMTKAITTTAAMQMVEQHKLSLEEPISAVLPELKDAQVLTGFDATGTPQLRPAKRAITLHHLLTHTAGFTYDLFNGNVGRYEKQAGLPSIMSCKNDALRTPLVFDPGDRWDYGINIDWAGKAVERVSGQSLEQYFHGAIFEPLGMADTSFRINQSQRERLVSMHARQPVPMHMPESEGALAPMQFEMPQDPEFFMGGGGLYSTAADYLKFTQMILHEGRSNGAQLLAPETVALMSRNQIGDLTVTRLKSEDPKASNDAEFFPGMVKKWGFGFMLNTETAPTGRSANSLAWAGLANTYFWIDPSKRVTGVILMQFLPFADEKALYLFAQFEKSLYGSA